MSHAARLGYAPSAMSQSPSAFGQSAGTSRSVAAFALSSVGLCLALAACQSNAPAPAAEQKPTSSVAASPSPAAAPAGATAAPRGKTYGAPLTNEAASSLSDVLISPDGFQGKTVTVEGHVRRACSRKGCWMEISTAQDEAAPGCRVTFKDYGFFVPTDSQGADARVQGLVEVTQVPKARVDHLEGEGARFAHKNADGSATEVRIVATGVELRRS